MLHGRLTGAQQPLREAVATVRTPLQPRTPSNEQRHHSGKWSQLKGKAQAKWGDLTNDDFDVAEGNAEYLAGRLQERYGWAKDRAEKEVREFQDAVSKDYPDYK